MTRSRIVRSVAVSLAVYAVLAVVMWLLGSWLALLAPLAPVYAAIQIVEEPEVAILPLSVSAAVIICGCVAWRRPQSRLCFWFLHLSLAAYYILSLWLAYWLSRNLPSGM
jgi:hypothetical protein